MNKIKECFSFLAIALLSSCTCTPKIITVQPPKINLPADPENVTLKLNSKSSPDEIIKAWVATAVGYKSWNRAVRKQIDSLNPK